VDHKALERARARSRRNNFDIAQEPAQVRQRENDQRKVIFEQRHRADERQHAGDTVRDMRHEVVPEVVANHSERALRGAVDVNGLSDAAGHRLKPRPTGQAMGGRGRLAEEEIDERIREGERRADGQEGGPSSAPT